MQDYQLKIENKLKKNEVHRELITDGKEQRKHYQRQRIIGVREYERNQWFDDECRLAIDAKII